MNRRTRPDLFMYVIELKISCISIKFFYDNLEGDQEEYASDISFAQFHQMRYIIDKSHEEAKRKCIKVDLN